jgi:hypothetical protein
MAVKQMERVLCPPQCRSAVVPSRERYLCSCGQPQSRTNSQHLVDTLSPLTTTRHQLHTEHSSQLSNSTPLSPSQPPFIQPTLHQPISHSLPSVSHSSTAKDGVAVKPDPHAVAPPAPIPPAGPPPPPPRPAPPPPPPPSVAAGCDDPSVHPHVSSSKHIPPTSSGSWTLFAPFTSDALLTYLLCLICS